jgi:hypothetical protein
MKTILTTFLLFISFLGKSQTSDIMYVPSEKSLIVTYNNNYNGFGIYIGGYLTTSYPQPFIYTTPQSRANRVGISFTNHKIAVMGGVFAENYVNDIEFKPDVWFKIYPLRILTNTKSIPDFTVGVNYAQDFRVGFGLSIPFGGIY